VNAVGIGIRSTGSYLPDRVVTNDELAQHLDTSDAWIVEHTGIRTRRRAQPGEASSDLGAAAARRAISNAGLTPFQIDGIVVATSSPDWVQPATASSVQAKLGISTGPAFDVSAVCSGFVYALATAAGLMTAFDHYQRLLVVGCEAYSQILDYQDRSTCVFFGDGAGAVVLAPVPDGYGVLSASLHTDSSLVDIVGIAAGGSVQPASAETVAQRRHYFRMNGRAVWDFATSALPLIVKQALAEAGLNIDDVDLLITHQANRRIIEAVGAELGIAPHKVPVSVDRYGNTAAASIPITLDEAVAAAGAIRRGSHVVLAAVGGGMTAGAVVLRWY
jgi:3-oxoacyl-[acyl-carrier-protein] synthase III